MRSVSFRFAQCAALLAAGTSLAAAQATAPHPAVDRQRGLVDEYCVACHNFEDWAGGVAFDTLDIEDIPKDAPIWEEAVRKLRAGVMPPAGEPRPDGATLDDMIGFLESTLDAAAAEHPDPGHIALHRLNRTEYANAVEDLLGLRIDPKALLPKDDEAEGFDNIASVLKVSPSFLEQYVAAAASVTAQAVGSRSARAESKTYRAPPANQGVHIAGLPLGTRGGMLVEHHFPVDGEYAISIFGLAGAGYVYGLDHPHTVVMTIDGERVFEGELGGPDEMRAVDLQQAPAVAAINDRFRNVKVNVKAGPHEVGVAFIARTFAESDEILHSFNPGEGMDRIPRVARVEINGPLAVAGLSDTPSRRHIFSCYPATAAEELPCAREIIERTARLAFRRPVGDADLAAPLRFFAEARAAGDFDAGIQNALTSILASPKFLYRAEIAPADLAPGAIYRISDLELASRLSFFLWSRLPDAELLGLAEQGRLSDPQVLDAQVARMLADPKANSLVSNFAVQWLRLRKLDDIDPDQALFPNFDNALREAFRTEIELFVASVLRENRSVLDLLTADYTFVNERLALHYGIPGVRGDQFRRVRLDNPARHGLLGKGGILLLTSYPNRTSPVLRGAYLLENIIGSPPPTPPANVEALPETSEGGVALTVRERMVKHRENPACHSCHAVMDPLGLALENFDAIGQWQLKDRDAGTLIDASGELADGHRLSGPQDIVTAILQRRDQFPTIATEKLMMFALGRAVEFHDMPAIRRIVRDAAAQDYRLPALIGGIIHSEPFRMRKLPTGDELQTADATASNP